MTGISQQHGKCIVVVDPCPTDYLPLMAAGRSRSLSFCFFSCGADALGLRWCGAGQARLWMINICLPDMTGLELCELLQPRLAGTPALLIADRYDPDDELSVLGTGTLHYVCKPLKASWLNNLLQADNACRASSSMTRPAAKANGHDLSISVASFHEPLPFEEKE